MIFKNHFFRLKEFKKTSEAASGPKNDVTRIPKMPKINFGGRCLNRVLMPRTLKNQSCVCFCRCEKWFRKQSNLKFVGNATLTSEV